MLKLGRPKDEAGNCFSILVGANGTRKSRTLRDMVDITMLGLSSKSNYIEGKAGHIRLWRAAVIPRVIAVSGVATDRFPSRLKPRKSRNPKTSYNYIGPRTDNNLVSRAQAVQQIALAILADHKTMKTRASHLRSVFAILQLDAGIYFELEKTQEPARAWSMAKIREQIVISGISVTEYFQQDDLLRQCMQFLRSKRRAEIRLDLDDLDVFDINHEDADVLYVLLHVGALRVSKCHAIDAAGEPVDLRELSSGQWHLLSSLIFVAAAVKDDTLVLVDEPENSLHPAWQQEYLPLLQEAISSSKGVHVVVSTHSPHVASSLSPDVAEVVALSRSRFRVTSKLLTSGPYGWAADDILRVAFGLETTRSRGFTEKVDTALKLFAKGNRKDPTLVEQVQALALTAPDLPKDDAVREIIQTMSALVGQEAKD